KHWDWIASYYMCNIGDVYKSAMPSGFLLESETLITSKKDFDVSDIQLSDDEYLVYEALQKQSALKVQEVSAILNKKATLPVINKLIAKNAISLQEEINEKYKPKTIRYIRMPQELMQQDQLSGLMELLSRSQKQRDAVMYYFQLQARDKKPISKKQFTEESGISSAVIKSLVDKGVFEEYILEEDRIQFEKDDNSGFELSDKQQEAFESVKQSFDTYQVTLLHGITSSGKTEIYIK